MVEDTFEKTATFLLDNKMGMAEHIKDLFLLDFVLKDRDQLIIVFSGMVFLTQVLYMREKQVKKKDYKLRSII